MSSRVARSTGMSPPPSTPDPTKHLSVWSIIIPVKQTTIGKSRLHGLPDDARQALARAFALDTAAAAVMTPGVRRVVVITNDPDPGGFVDVGAEVVDDGPDSGLNAALVHGAHHVAASDRSTGVVALTGDLPALRSDVLGLALSAAPARRWFVSDSAGTGTTLLAARGERLSPSFGRHSRAAHKASGAVELELPGLERLRRDVDTEIDLWDAVRLGVGRHTCAVLARFRLDRIEPLP